MDIKKLHVNQDFSHVGAMLEALRLPFLLRHFPKKTVWSAYVCINCFLSVALLAFLGQLTHSPFVFPSLGPTAYMLFFSPLADSSSPKSAVLGHGIGLVCGCLAFRLTGMGAFSHRAPDQIDWPKILAAAIALSLTATLMVVLSVNHPPAAATTLIVALGILTKPQYLVIIEIAVGLLLLQAWAINRFAGLPFPRWHTIQNPK